MALSPQKLIKAYTETRRILRLTRKPKRSEYNETAKITGLGMILIGFIGFIIFLISQILR
jgi:protein transport protein SEC61 subunit gamma-like protein